LTPWLTGHDIRSGVNPYGIASIETLLLKDRQDYDVSLTLSVPRSPSNLDQGNFMVALYFLTSGKAPQRKMAPYAAPEPHEHFDGKSVIFTSRRPALIPYQDPVIALGSKVFFFLYHVLFPGSQTCSLVVHMAERLQFRGKSMMPASVYVEIQGGQRLDVYSASVTMTAQLRGLRWLMVNYRLTSFATLTTLFWLCEVSFMCIGWLLWSSWGQTRTDREVGFFKDGRRSSAELEDSPAAPLAHERKPPLRHGVWMKEEGRERRLLEDIPPAGAEADDEDDEDDEELDRGGEWTQDSGVGTSFRDGAETAQLRRRSSHQQR
jgi:seipin